MAVRSNCIEQKRIYMRTYDRHSKKMCASYGTMQLNGIWFQSMNRIDCLINTSLKRRINTLKTSIAYFELRSTVTVEYCLAIKTENVQISLTVIIFVDVGSTPFVVIIATATARHSVSDCLLFTRLAQNHC